MKIAVLGAGPVGLVVAQTAALFGHDVTVHGIRRKSNIKGAQYIHRSMDEITTDEPAGHVSYIKLGTREGYAYKVYGDPNAACSWDKFEGEVPAWPMVEIYDKLWDEWGDQVFDQEIRYATVGMLLSEYDLVFSSINPLGYCEYGSEAPGAQSHGHDFKWAQIYTSDDDHGCQEGTIVYSGDPEHSWYRTSFLFGHVATEYPGTRRGAVQGSLSVVRKPLTTTCTCHMGERFVRIGRYGEFRKGLLVTDAWAKAVEVLDAL